jgi:hypothetical protein
MPSGEQKPDIRKRSQLQRARADATATTEAGHPPPRNLGLLPAKMFQKCARNVSHLALKWRKSL